jgi:type II secretion system protein C
MLPNPLFPAVRLGLTLVWLALGAFWIAHLTSLFVSEALGAKHGPMGGMTPSSVLKGPTPQELGNLILRSSVFQGDRDLSVFSGLNTSNVDSTAAGLTVELMGTVVGGGSLGYAILQSPQSGIQTLYRLGDSVPQMGTLVRIDRHKVVIALLNGGEAILEPGWMGQAVPQSGLKPTSQISSSGGTVRTVVQRREISEAFSNIPRLLNQAQAIPVISANGMNGVSFVSIQSASIFERLGFQVGDVLKAINGMPLRDPGTLLSALRRIQDEPTVSLDVIRKDQNITLNYDIL